MASLPVFVRSKPMPCLSARDDNKPGSIPGAPRSATHGAGAVMMPRPHEMREAQRPAIIDDCFARAHHHADQRIVQPGDRARRSAPPIRAQWPPGLSAGSQASRPKAYQLALVHGRSCPVANTAGIGDALPCRSACRRRPSRRSPSRPWVPPALGKSVGAQHLGKQAAPDRRNWSLGPRYSLVTCSSSISCVFGSPPNKG